MSLGGEHYLLSSRHFPKVESGLISIRKGFVCMYDILLCMSLPNIPTSMHNWNPITVQVMWGKIINNSNCIAFY